MLPDTSQYTVCSELTCSAVQLNKGKCSEVQFSAVHYTAVDGEYLEHASGVSLCGRIDNILEGLWSLPQYGGLAVTPGHPGYLLKKVIEHMSSPLNICNNSIS